MRKKFQNSGRLYAGKIAFIYAIAGSMWILFSDAAVEMLFKDTAALSQAQNLKGVSYILVTTLLVYGLLKKYMKAIREQEGKVQLLAENSRDVIWSMDMQSHITYINPAIERLLGIPASELTGKHVSRMCTEKSLAQLSENIAAELSKGPKASGMVIVSELVDHKGAIIPVEVNGRLVFNQENEPVSIQGVTRDIRERLALQTQLQQAQKMESIGTMASGIAHEINNPITIISGCAEIVAQSDTITKDEKTYLENILDQTKQIHQIISNLLGFARLEENPEPEKLASAAPLEKCLELIKTSLRHDQIKVETDIQHPLPDFFGYPYQIQQLLLNLMDNARYALNEKYPQNHPEKIIKVSITCTEKKQVCYTVTDYGTGMSPEQLEKLFDPFYTTKPEGKGTGLGMWIIHQIVKNHRGYILIESKEFQYTRFDILLPLDFRTQTENSRPTVQIIPPNTNLFSL